LNKKYFFLNTSEATLTPFDNFEISVIGAFTRNAGRVIVSGAVKNASVEGTELPAKNLFKDAPFLSFDACYSQQNFQKII